MFDLVAMNKNLARNGAQSNNTEDYMLSLARNKYEDKPAIVIYSLVIEMISVDGNAITVSFSRSEMTCATNLPIPLNI
jgi:hypothetical protein